MSYDLGIGDESFNYTYNVAPMWYSAKPEKGIRTIYGMTGKGAAKVLIEMMDHMASNWGDMVSKDPPNGWGSASGAFDFLCRLCAASMRNPDLVWDGD